MTVFGGEGDRVEPPRAGRDLEPAVEHRQHDEGEPEGRRRDADQRHDAGQVIDPAVAPHRREDAERDADDEREQERRRSRARASPARTARCRRARGAARRWSARDRRQEAAQEDQVSLPQRQVEAVFRPPFGDDRLVRGGDVAELRQHRVAGHGVRDEEDHERRKERHDHRDRKPRDDVARQGSGAPARGRDRTRRYRCNCAQPIPPHRCHGGGSRPPAVRFRLNMPAKIRSDQMALGRAVAPKHRGTPCRESS